MRTFLAIAVVVALVIAGWWVVNAPESSALDPDVSPSTETKAIDPKLSTSDTSERTLQSVPFEGREEVPASAKSETETAGERPAAVKAKPREIELRVVVIDESGNRLENEDGILSFRISPSISSESYVNLRIVAGRARLKFLPDATIRLRKGMMGGRALQTPYFIDAPPKVGPWTLELDWLFPFRLRVQDARTKLDLNGVQVRHVTDDQLDDMWHPGAPLSGKLIMNDASSPLELPANAKRSWQKRVLWVGAAGYAWTRIKAVHTGAEGIVLLEPGGGLELILEGKELPAGYFIRLRRSGGGLWAQAPLPKTNHCTFFGLKPGRYTVSVERGAWFRRPSSVATREVEVLPSTVVKASLAIEETVDQPQATSVSGLVRVDPIWHSRLSLRFEPLGGTRSWASDAIWIRGKELKAVTGTAGDFQFSIDKIVPGAWQVIVSPMGFRQRVEISPQGEFNLLIDIPAPAHAALKLTDENSGKPMQPEEGVDWHAKLPEGVSGWSPEDAKYDTKRKAYLFTAPAGPVSVSTHPEGYVWTTKEFILTPGENEIHLALARSCGVLVSVKCQGKTIPVDWDWHISLSEVGGEGHSKTTSSRGNKKQVTVSHPGRYTLTLSRCGMYSQPDDQVIDVPVETIVPVTIELELKR